MRIYLKAEGIFFFFVRWLVIQSKLTVKCDTSLSVSKTVLVSAYRQSSAILLYFQKSKKIGNVDAVLRLLDVFHDVLYVLHFYIKGKILPPNVF